MAPSKSESLGDRLKRLVAQRLAATLADNPEALARVKDLGLVDDGWLADPQADPLRPLMRLRELSSAVAEQPSILGESRSLEVMALQSQMAGAGASDEPDAPALTIVFTDLEGFTAYTSAAGDASAGRVLRSHYAAVDDIVAGRGGAVVKRLGDGHMATFPTPRAAVLAALELVRAAPDDLLLRAGSHHGGVVRLGDDVVGHAVNLASRVADSAAGGHLRVTLPVREGAGPLAGVRYESPIDEQFKGIEGVVSVCEVVST